ncbi:MAG: alpha/beta fold hydrolase [Gallionella sp.]
MRLHVDDYGYTGAGSSGELLLIHGWGMHSGLWGGIAEKLAQHFRVMTVDLPGHGYNAGVIAPFGMSLSKTEPANSLRLDKLTASGSAFLLDAVVDELSAQFTGPLAICGWSLGGQIALRWAMRQPQQVKRLVLVATTPCFERRPDWPCAMAAETMAAFDAALRQNYAQTLRRFLALQVRGGKQERALLVTLRRLLFSRGEPDFHALQGGLNILRVCDLRSALSGVNQPSLVIAGEHDTLAPLLAAQYLTRHLPNARLAEIKGAAHAPFLSHPNEFLKYVVNFVSEQ